MKDQGQLQHPQGDAVKAAAVSAALNVPTRSKSRSSKSASASLLRLESFDNIPDYLKDNECVIHCFCIVHCSSWSRRACCLTQGKIYSSATASAVYVDALRCEHHACCLSLQVHCGFLQDGAEDRLGLYQDAVCAAQ